MPIVKGEQVFREKPGVGINSGDRLDPGTLLLIHGYAKEAMNFLTGHSQRDWVNRAVATRMMGRPGSARDLALLATQEWPDSAEAWNTLGLSLQDLGGVGNHREALEHFRRAHSLRPHSAQVQLNLANSLLLNEKWVEGFTTWEAARFMRSWSPLPNLPPWDGVTHGRILLLSEGGYGDVINMSRFFPLLPESGPGHVLWTWDRLCSEFSLFLRRDVSLLPHNVGVDTASYDFCLSILSLPSFLLTDPAQVPPLQFNSYADQVELDTHLSVTGPYRGKVGICWEAEEAASFHKIRSIPTGSMIWWMERAPAAVRERLISLVPGKRLSKDHPDAPLHWGQTAAIINALDLVITVDTAVAHLAGALGKPTIMILPSSPEWKWGLTGNRTPWYPSMYLMRNCGVADWESSLVGAGKLAESLLYGGSQE